jgi:hypothetical protein
MYYARFPGRGNRYVHRVLIWFEKLSCRLADQVIATSQSYREMQMKRGRVPAECTTIVRNGPNLARLKRVEPDSALQGKADVILGYVGSMGYQDGVDYLLRAVHSLVHDLNRKDFYCVLMGTGDAYNDVRALARELELDDFVWFTGHVSEEDLIRYLSTADIFLAPEPKNPFTDRSTMIKVMEYMTMSRPTVGFDLAEHRVTAKDAALYAKPNDEREFARLIAQLMDNPAQRRRMGEFGRQRIENKLAWPHQEQCLLDVYRKLGMLPPEESRANEDPKAQCTEPHREECLPRSPEFSQVKDLKYEFVIPEAAAREVGRHWLRRDDEAARLSAAFRAYYRLRPLIPLPLRQLMQHARFKNVARPDWYLPSQFLDALTTSLQRHHSLQMIHPWPRPARFAFVLTHDVDTADGMRNVPRIAALEEELGFRSSWNILPYKYRIDEGLIRELKSRSFEIGIHGFSHDGRLFSSRKTFARRAAKINDALAQYGAVGFRAPMVHRNSEWLQELNVEYDASYFDTDPFQAMPGGVGSLWPFRMGRFVELPYTLPQDHTLFVVLGKRHDRIWRKKLDYIKKYCGMALMITHPEHINSPERLEIYREFLIRVRDEGDYWHALPKDVARWWRDREQSTLQEEAQDGGAIQGPVGDRGTVVTLTIDEQIEFELPIAQMQA